jgi:RNA 2',3'-cyclic 3'-phosphodiesterase
LTHARDTPPATVDPDARLRLFCALRLPDDVVDDLAAWQLLELRGGRPVPPENVHVTLAFLGARPAAELEPIAEALREAARGAERPELEVRGYRETRSVGMLVCDDHAGRATAFADDLFGRLEALGVYRREGRPWLPHVTVIRFRERPRLRPLLPERGPFSPSDAAVYLSRLRPTGAQYEVLETAGLGG